MGKLHFVEWENRVGIISEYPSKGDYICIGSTRVPIDYVKVLGWEVAFITAGNLKGLTYCKEATIILKPGHKLARYGSIAYANGPIRKNEPMRLWVIDSFDRKETEIKTSPVKKLVDRGIDGLIEAITSSGSTYYVMT